MGEKYFEDVTERAAGEAPFGVVVAELEERGWQVLGRVAQRSVPGSRLAWDRHERERVAAWAARAPGTLLASGDRSAYAVVDAYGDAPLLRLRTLLDDGTVVETISVASHGVLRPRGQDPFAGFLMGEAAGRSVALLRDVTAAEAAASHARSVSAATASGARPVSHDDRAAAVALWNDLARHTTASARALTRRLRLVWLLAGVAAYVAYAVLARALVEAVEPAPSGRLTLHLLAGVVALAGLVVAMRWSDRLVRRSRGWRQPYASAPGTTDVS